MVKAEDSWLFQQHSAWPSPDLNHMSTLLPPRQQNGFPSYMNPCTFSANVSLPGFSVPALPGLNTGQTNGAHGLSQILPPLMESSFSPPNPYFKESQTAFPHGLGIKTTPNDVSGSTQKRFLIFDQSGNQTRLFFSPFGSSSQNQTRLFCPFLSSSQYPIVAPKKHVGVCHLGDEKEATVEEKISPTKSIIQETSDENHIIDEGSEMREDTEEINALLYSDDDYDDDDDGEDDEVTSTGRSPFAIEGNHENYDPVGEITEEVASSDGSTKRQRLLDGGYKKSSVVDAATSVKLNISCEYGNDAELSCTSGRVRGKDMGSILRNKQSTKDKIHETLKILESIIPGSKKKDPLLIIDEAINYLKFLKLKGKSLGVSYP